MFDHHLHPAAHLAGEPAAAPPAAPAGCVIQGDAPVLPGGCLAGQLVSQDWIVAAAQRAVAAIAPRELAVFTTMANLWLAEGDRPRRARPLPGGALAPRPAAGYRINAVLFSELAFPVISGALSEILGNSAWERISPQRQPACRRMAGAGEHADPPGAKGEVRLTIEQAGALEGACERHARAAGLPSMTAAKLARAVLGEAGKG